MKIKVTRTQILTYEPAMENYPGCSTIQDVVAVDNECAQEDPELFFDTILDSETFLFEIVEG